MWFVDFDTIFCYPLQWCEIMNQIWNYVEDVCNSLLLCHYTEAYCLTNSDVGNAQGQICFHLSCNLSHNAFLGRKQKTQPFDKKSSEQQDSRNPGINSKKGKFFIRNEMVLHDRFMYDLFLQTLTCQCNMHTTSTKIQIRDVRMSYRSFQCTEGKSLWRKRSWDRRWAFYRHRLISSTKNHTILKQNRCWWHSEVNSYDNTTTKHFSN